MTELSLGVPGETDVAEALESIRQIRWLGEIGEIDLTPYLAGLLLQLEEILSATPITPRHPVVAEGGRGGGDSQEPRRA